MEQERDMIEKKKKCLRSYKKTRHRIDSLEQQKKQIRIDMQHVRASLGDGMPRGRGGLSDVSEFFERMSDLEEQIDDSRIKMYEQQKKITDAINMLEEDDECTIMTEKYINGKTWEEVAADNGYAWMTMHRIHGRALKKINLDLNLG